MANKLKIVGVISMAIIFSWGAAYAALDFNLDQSKVRLSIPAGGSHSGVLKAYSTSKRPLQLKIYLEDWKYAAPYDGTKVFSPAKTNANSCAEWIKVRPTDTVLPAYGAISVNYTLNVPVDAKGGYYAVIWFEVETSQEELTGEQAINSPLPPGIKIAVKLAALFYVEVKNTVNREQRFSNFSVSRGLKDSYDLSFDLVNTGNSDITAGGNFYVMDNAGVIYGRGQLTDAYTLPGDSAQMRSQWRAQMSAGNYVMVFTLDLGKGFGNAPGAQKGLLVTKEASIEIDEAGEVRSVSALK